MADEIRADYNELNNVAGQFANQSQQINQMMQRVTNSLGKLQDGGWMGKAAEQFFAEMGDTVLPATKRLQDALEDAGRTTTEISNTVKDAEDEAGGLFR